MQNHIPSLIVFTKIPGLQAVKTRLSKSSELPDQVIIELAWAFLLDTLFAAGSAMPGHLALASSPGTSRIELEKRIPEFLLDCFGEKLDALKFDCFAQENTPFATRVERTIRQIRTEGISPFVIIGSDAPLISCSIIHDALEAVSEGKAVVGPAQCGGIYLFGAGNLMFCNEGQIASVFQDPEKTELECFASSVRRSKDALHALPLCPDVDTAEDLVSLMAILNSIEPVPGSIIGPALASRAVINKRGLRCIQSEESTRLVRVSVQ